MTKGSSTTSPSSGGGSLPAGCTTATCPAAAASTTPLSMSVLLQIAKCPAMKADLENLQKNGWTVVWGSAGGGGFSDRPNKKITLDPSACTDDKSTIRDLAHEMGHAQYVLPSVTPDGKTRAEYVAALVQANLEDEGEAT